MIRVLIVEDSKTSALLLELILESEPDIKVVGVARNGEEGLRKTISLKPDIVTMDIHLPGIDGFQATRLIMEKSPRPIIIVTGDHMHRDEVDLSFRSLNAGALAVLKKPNGPESPDYQSNAEELISIVKLMAEVKVVRRYPKRQTGRTIDIAKKHGDDYKIIAIGASTGGPAAISSILAKIPERIQTPILIVQHISDGFDVGFADWLTSTTHRQVSIADDRMAILPGMVLIAPKGRHMGLKDETHIKFAMARDYDSNFCPSANYLFEDVGRVYGRNAIGIILTGMGNDGLEGLKILKQDGGFVIAQDEASCIVFGMPKAAIDAGITDQILPLEEIAPVISTLLDKENA
jgi:two-component system chemotaxis response regulator CheB